MTSSQAGGVAFLVVVVVFAAYGLRGQTRDLSKISLRDWLLYIGIALLPIAAIVVVSEYDERNGIQRQSKGDLTVCVVTAALVFGHAIKGFHRLLRSRGFWALFAALITAHFSILLPWLSGMDRVPVMLIALITPIELGVVVLILTLVFPGVANWKRQS